MIIAMIKTYLLYDHCHDKNISISVLILCVTYQVNE